MIQNQDRAVAQNEHSLPEGWEKAYDEGNNRYFYVDHNTRTTTWLHPLDRELKPTSPADCFGDQLPYGWEEINDPIVGTYYADHLGRRNQWSSPVSDWRQSNQTHHYNNNHHLISNNERSGNSLDSNNQTNSLTTTSKPDTSFQASDIERSATSLNNSASLETEIVDSFKSLNGTRNSKYDASLIDIMDNCFGRESSQSVEV